MADDALPRSAAGPNNPWLVAIIVSIATFMEVLDTTITNVSLRNIGGSLAASADETTYIVTSYLMANAIILPISGWLANVIGRKRFYMICVGLFTIASALCALSTSLWMMVGFRVLQGFAGGGLAPVEQSIFADTFAPAKRAAAFAIYGLTLVTAPAVGPILGGIITDRFSWHWVFLINIPVGCISLILTWLFVYDSKQTKADRKQLLSKGLRVDYFGFVLVLFGFATLQFVLDRFEREDGFSSPMIVAMTLVSVLSLITLVFWELFHSQPLINFRLFKSRGFAISNIVLFVFGMVVISSTQLTPQFTQTLMGYDATNAGLTLGLGGIITIIIMPFVGIITGKVPQPKWLIFGALIGAACAELYVTSLDTSMGFYRIAFARALLAFWLPFIFIPVATVQFIGVPADQNNNASAILNLTRNLGGSVGVSLTTTELTWRGQVHHERLAEHVGAFNGYGLGHSLAAIGQTVATQASLLSYLDVFALLGAVAMCAAPIALLLPKPPKGAAAGAH